MKMDYRIMTAEERKYTYAQSQQLSMQTGLIGYLRADMDSNGEGFFSSWNEWRESLNTDEFKEDIDFVINALRGDGELLHNRSTLSKFCYGTPESAFNDDRNEYGIRVDTEKYAFLCRMNPNKGEYNLYCHCYVRDSLNRNIEKAARGIRFIDSIYHDLFRIADGERIAITSSFGERNEYTCRYIDETHVEVGNNLYHICEFAERMEQNGATYKALKPLLPEQCYGTLHTGELIIIKYGEKGYYNTDIPTEDKKSMKALADEMNAKLGVTKAQAAAMLAGSMYGWSCPAANPASYDENGKPIKPKETDRGDAR